MVLEEKNRVAVRKSTAVKRVTVKGDHPIEENPIAK